MRRLGNPNTIPTSAAHTPASTNATRSGIPGTRSMKLYAANAPTAMNAAVPSESWPAYPVRRFKPSVASANISSGTRIAENQYSLAISGTTRNAKASRIATAIRSWRIGKICWSSAYVALN
jgi:hypothetical protein